MLCANPYTTAILFLEFKFFFFCYLIYALDKSNYIVLRSLHENNLIGFTLQKQSIEGI